MIPPKEKAPVASGGSTKETDTATVLPSRSEFKADPVTEIRQLHAEIVGAIQTNLDRAIRIGELLATAKAELKHGDWLPWLKENVPFSEVTAQRYMRVHARRDELKSVTLTDLTGAYRMLSAPEEAKQESDATDEDSPQQREDWLLHFDVEMAGITASLEVLKQRMEMTETLPEMAAIVHEALRLHNQVAHLTILSERRVGRIFSALKDRLGLPPDLDLNTFWPWLPQLIQQCNARIEQLGGVAP